MTKITPSVYPWQTKTPIYNEDTNIFCLNITVPSVALARTICQNWDESSAEIYTNVVTSLMPNKKQS